jgi:hypothetical protein
MYQIFHKFPHFNVALVTYKQVLTTIISTSSAFLMLTLPAIIHAPNSKLLAAEVVSQDLDAAIFFSTGGNIL